MRKYADVDFRYEDIAQVRGNAQLAAVFDRIRSAFRAARDAIAAGEGLVTTVQDDVPPGAGAAALPTAGAALVGKIVHLDLAGAADDTVHICIKEAGGTYAWREFTIT